VSPILYLYAIVDGEPSGPLGEGIGGEPLHRVEAGSVSAVAGLLDAPPRPEAEALKRQDAVVRRLAGLFAALLPARFGTGAADEAALAARLLPRAGELAAALALVRGCVQMTLRVFGEPDPAPEAPPDAAGGVTGGPGARYLEERRRERERLRSLPEIAPLSEALRPLLRAERVERRAAGGAGPLLGTAYHLVPREETAAYLAALDGARSRIGGRRIAASGPWPPYAFAAEGSE
jgi:hypothetical protein